MVTSVARATPLAAQQPRGVVDTIGVGLVKVMDVRVPTVSRFLTDEQKQQVKATLQPGDILLETNNAYPGWQVAQKVLFGSRFSHCAFYEGGDKIVESVSEAGVRESSVDTFLETYHVAVLRPHYQSPQDWPAAQAYALSCLGRPYNTSFDMSSDKSLYCSQLLYNGLEKMPHPITTVPVLQAFGRPIVPPDAFIRSSDFDVVWDSGCTFAGNMASHWPLAAGSAAGAVVGGLLGGCGGAALGGAAGLGATWALARFWDPELSKGKITGTGM